ncbi:MAG: thioredoxin domain-containing protein [Gammaproteobacteria bacterium]|nr:thioredoxin domain-containing protein [Gammaproteobacteria bacterium]
MKNHLASETSPYLLQHADNPVDWHPWNEEALALARELDKPILLSIGYSACHWCHVMAHESFEDENTARVMNELFVNIKVDREERPDLDKIYQFAHQMLAQRGGGWPLTMILTPDDQTPFFAGTYFPREPRYGMPSFVDIIQRVAGFYRQRKDEVKRQNDALKDVLRQIEASFVPTRQNLSPLPLDEARRQLEKSYDGLYGGFGEAPKFPHPGNITRLFRHWSATSQDKKPDKTALDMAVTTLKAMGMGGINDQLGGGFCRYSVDQEWMIPHFEKMLYDNGPLLCLYTDAWAITGEAFFKRVASETAEWVMREMQSDEGGYYSSMDADSEGEEGRFYVWDVEAVKSLLSEEEYNVVAHHYGLNRQANFEGQWHLHVYETLEDTARRCHISLQDALELLASARQAMFRIREERVRPGRDDKVLTSWNGLMIKGMAMAGRRLQRMDFLHSAESALAFIKRALYTPDRLLASFKDGKAHLNGYLDDYVFLIDGILELLQARWNAEDLAFAIALADAVLEKFEDRKAGGFYFTSHDHETLIQRPKVLMDESLPAGNGVAAFVLQRLGHLLGEQRYLDAAERTLKAAWDSIVRTPYAHNTLLDALEEYLYPTQTVVLRGDANTLKEWRAQSAAVYAPRRLLLAIPSTEQELPGLLGQRVPQGKLVAYICDGHQCRPALTGEAALKETLAIQ